MTRLAASILMAFCSLFAGASLAVPLETSVNYISATAIYLDAGRMQGIQKGDGAEIRRGDSLIARVEIEFVADNSSSCRILESTGVVRVGDRAIVHITPSAPLTQPDTVTVQPVPEAPPSPSRTARSGVNRVTGHISVQALSQNDRAESNNDYVEPAVLLRGQVSNLFDTGHTLSVRLRSRTTDRPHGTSDDWVHQVYELALYYDSPSSRVHYGAGRVLSNRISGIGYLDGALLDYRVHENWTVGAFGGAQPDLSDYSVDPDQTKTGIFASYDHGDFATSRVSGTLALAGNYLKGNINREFAYEQLSYSMPRLFLYQSAELEINRGWRKDVQGSSLDLSNILLNARYSPLTWLTTNLSYDNRTTFRTYENRTIADSLFDDALRQGWRLGVNVKLPEQLYMSAEAGLRTKEHEGTETKSASGGFGSYDLFASGIQAGARVNVFQGRFSEGFQPSLTLSRDLFRRVRVSAQYGLNQYTIVPAQTDVSNQWFRLNTDWTITRHVYGSLYGEVYRGDGLDADRAFAEIGYRF